jgi:hypothetical protein
MRNQTTADLSFRNETSKSACLTLQRVAYEFIANGVVTKLPVSQETAGVPHHFEISRLHRLAKTDAHVLPIINTGRAIGWPDEDDPGVICIG